MDLVEKRSDLQVDISYRQIFKMALPISFAILIPQFNFVVNNVFLGHFSSQALATAGITGVYYLIFSAIGYGMNNGLQSIISKRAGENKPDEIGQIFNQGIYISLFVSFIGILVTWLILPTIFQWLIYDADRSVQAIDFLKIRIWGLPFLYVYQMRNALLVSINQSKFLIAGTIVEALSNVVFDYLLIFGKFGFPQMGFNGAAVASVISEFLGMLVIYLVLRKEGLIERFSLFGSLVFNKKVVLEILNFSSPLIFQQAFSIAAWEYFFILLEHQGTTSLQVSNGMRNVFGIFGSVSWAFSATANSMISNILGQGLVHLFWKLIGKITWISISVTLLLCVLLNAFPLYFLSIFGQSSDFYSIAVPTIRVVSVAMILMSISTIILNSVIATGNAKIGLGAEVLSLIFYVFYIYWALEINSFPVWIAWMSEWIYWIFLLAPCLFFLLFGKWKDAFAKTESKILMS